MATESHDEVRRRHIDGFVDSFIESKKRERYRSFLMNPKKRSKFTDDLNHKLVRDLIDRHIVEIPPHFPLGAIAYLISDEREVDDNFVAASEALNLVLSAEFGTIASIIPGVLVVLKEESPATVRWLHRHTPK